MVAKYLSIRYKCLPSSSTSRNKAAKLFSDNALLPFRPTSRALPRPFEPPLAALSLLARQPFLGCLRQEARADNTDKLNHVECCATCYIAETFIIAIFVQKTRIYSRSMRYYRV